MECSCWFLFIKRGRCIWLAKTSGMITLFVQIPSSHEGLSNPATLNTSASVDLSSEGAKTTLASNEMSNNVKILRKLDFALEKSVRMTRMRPEGERFKNGKWLVQ